MYRNAFKRERSLEYERHYRLATMEMQRVFKSMPRPYVPRTDWFRQMYPKPMPSSFKPRMTRHDYDNWDMLYEQQRLKRDRSLRQRP
jgi:hypothetical protein